MSHKKQSKSLLCFILVFLPLPQGTYIFYLVYGLPGEGSNSLPSYGKLFKYFMHFILDGGKFFAFSACALLSAKSQMVYVIHGWTREGSGGE